MEKPRKDGSQSTKLQSRSVFAIRNGGIRRRRTGSNGSRHLFELFKKLQRKWHIKITVTATRVRLDYIKENSQPQSTKNRRIQEVLEAAKVILRELNSDPIVITGLPVQENVEYLWNQYQSLNEEDKITEWLWLHFAIGKVIDQYYQLL